MKKYHHIIFTFIVTFLGIACSSQSIIHEKKEAAQSIKELEPNCLIIQVTLMPTDPLGPDLDGLLTFYKKMLQRIDPKASSCSMPFKDPKNKYLATASMNIYLPTFDK